jgi:hypothetical protein
MDNYEISQRIDRLETKFDVRSDRIEKKLDACVEALAEAARTSAVHAAVCDADRKDLRHDQRETSTRLWKVVVLVVGISGSGIAGTEILRNLL